MINSRFIFLNWITLSNSNISCKLFVMTHGTLMCKFISRYSLEAGETLLFPYKVSVMLLTDKLYNIYIPLIVYVYLPYAHPTIIS